MRIKQFLEHHGYFVLMCLVIIILIVLVCLFPPEESILKSFGKALGEIFSDLIEGFNEGVKKSGK